MYIIITFQETVGNHSSFHSSLLFSFEEDSPKTPKLPRHGFPFWQSSSSKQKKKGAPREKFRCASGLHICWDALFQVKPPIGKIQKKNMGKKSWRNFLFAEASKKHQKHQSLSWFSKRWHVRTPEGYMKPYQTWGSKLCFVWKKGKWPADFLPQLLQSLCTSKGDLAPQVRMSQT